MKISIIKILSVALIPALWLLLKYCFDISNRFLPGPNEVFYAMADIEPSIFYHALFTVSRLCVGFVGGTFFGIAVGLFFFKYLTLEKLFSPSVHALRAVPAAASVPFFILWFGFSEFGRYLLIFMAVSLNVAVASYQILKNHSRAHLAFFKSFNIEIGGLPFRYSLPRIVQDLLPTLRYSLSLSIGAVTVSELLGAQVGLGYILQIGRATFSLSLMFLAIMAIGLIAAFADKALQLVWNRIVYWRNI